MYHDEELSALDPDRILVAVHELGHLFVLRHGDIATNGIRVVGKGPNAEGWTYVERSQQLDKSQWRWKLACSFAGRQAELRWCDEHGLRYPPERTCAGDMRVFKEEKVLAKQDGVSRLRSRLEADARRIVRAHWSKICRLTPKVARTGRL